MQPVELSQDFNSPLQHPVCSMSSLHPLLSLVIWTINSSSVSDILDINRAFFETFLTVANNMFESLV